MAVNLICRNTSLKLIYPMWNTVQCLRLLSKNKGEKCENERREMHEYPFHQRSSNKLDSMENFISDLTTRKLNKWNELRKEAINRNQSQSVEIASSDEQKRLIDEIHSCLDTHDDERLEMLIRKYLHSFDNAQTNFSALPRIVLLEVLELFCREGNRDLAGLLFRHFKTINLEFYNEHSSYFEILDLELRWKTAHNVDELLRRFEQKYLETSNKVNKSDRTMLRKLCLVMIDDTISRKGESAMIKLRESIERVSEESRDYQMMFDLWRKLFER